VNPGKAFPGLHAHVNFAVAPLVSMPIETAKKAVEIAFARSCRNG